MIVTHSEFVYDVQFISVAGQRAFAVAPVVGEHLPGIMALDALVRHGNFTLVHVIHTRIQCRCTDSKAGQPCVHMRVAAAAWTGCRAADLTEGVGP